MSNQNERDCQASHKNSSKAGLYSAEAAGVRQISLSRTIVPITTFLPLASYHHRRHSSRPLASCSQCYSVCAVSP
ncbi:hypothetical protein K438DRAFT_193071 [Mycena galopus ATCC 62051]|nr:hypothetical protein K438DRAFT_193071 [Mycena galopus ATCC 62051]